MTARFVPNKQLEVTAGHSAVTPNTTFVPSIRIQHLYISPGHSFFGRHRKPPAKYAMVEVPEILCLAGRGIEGDRFLDFKPDYKGQITFFAAEIYEELCGTMDVWDKPPAVFRRNVITAGIDLNQLIEREFEIQGVRFLGIAECTPCYWMDRAFGPGAEERLKGHGGLRAKILSSGTLVRDHVGETVKLKEERGTANERE